MQVQNSYADGDLTGQHALNRSLVFDIGFTALLFGLLIYGALYIEPAISANPDHRPVAAILIPALLPIGALTFLSFVERLFPPAGPRKCLRTYLLHLQINIFQFFVGGLFSIITVLACTAGAHRFGFSLGLIDLRFASGKGILGLVATAWLGAVVGDFFFYWFHRALHQTPVLWAHHKMHHMDEELESITYNRQNWIEGLFASIFLIVPSVILFKFDELDVWQLGLVSGSIVAVVNVLAAIGHLNVRWQVGRASLFYCSPQVHRIHHSRLPQHHDKNFAFVLPLWDWLFGTYYAPKRNEFPPTGVDGEVEIKSFLEAQIFTPREWWRMFRAWRAEQGKYF